MDITKCDKGEERIMFDRNLFTYDEENHLGYYNGVLVPSTTQLLDIVFPLDKDIPTERLVNASERGTEIHELIETLNSYFDNPFEYKHNLEVVNEVAKNLSNKAGKKELKDYVAFLNAYKLKPFDYEELIFLLDENGDLICYGHYDCTFQATQDISVDDIDLFRENQLYMVDFKTTSLFAKKKTQLQLSIYALAYEQSSKNFITNIYGLWLREGVKLIPLNRQDNTYVIKLCKELRKIYDSRNA